MRRLRSLLLWCVVAVCAAVVTLYASASFPTSVKSFSTKAAGDTIQASHINDIQDEIVAIENDLLTEMKHDLLFTDDTYDIGASGATRPRNLYLSGTIAVGGGQIAFPASQSASADANTLDDYEEGTWTPVIGGSSATSGQSYTTQTGTYTKIGRLVVARFTATLSAKGTITGNLQIQGLPFTVSGTLGASALSFQNLATSHVSLVAVPLDATTTAQVNGLTAAATSMSIRSGSDVGNTTQLTGQIVYFV